MDGANPLPLRALLWTNTLLVTAAAGAYLLAAVRPELLPQWLQPVGQPAGGTAWAVYCGSVLLILANGWALVRRRRPEALRFVFSEAPGGRVKVAREALETGLRQAGEALEEVTRLRIGIGHGGLKRIRVTGLFQCPEGVNNLAAGQRLRQALTQRFHDMVRPSEGVRVDFDIEFLGFAGRMPKKPEPEPAPEEVPEPFTGPRYPIDDDEGQVQP